MRKTIGVIIGAAILALFASAQYTPPSSSGSIQVSGTLTQAQILAMTNTNGGAVAIVPAQGAGTVIVVDGVAAQLVFSGAQYAGGANTSLHYLAGNNSTISGSFSSGIITAAQSTFATLLSVAQTQTTSANATNQGIGFELASNTPYTCGSTCGTFTYWVSFHVVRNVQ